MSTAGRRPGAVWIGAAALLLAAFVPESPARRAPNDQQARGRRGAVVAAEPHAAAIGLDVLRRGGNAVDAAAAVLLALAVTHPQAGNLGGGGFLLVHLADGREVALDFRETAPAAAHRDMYLRPDGTVDPERSLVGATAAGVPGSAAGIAWAVAELGTRPLAELAAPAIELAAQGFEIDHFLAGALRAKKAQLARFPSTRAVFFAGDEPLGAGDRLVQADLAATLQRFAELGAPGFYQGRTAELIVAQMERDGGFIAAGDLAAYRPVERQPLHGTYRGRDIVAFPPPSSGGVALVQMLHLLEPFDLGASGFGSSQTIHLMSEAMRRAYADRAHWLGDSDFVEVPVEAMLSARYATARGDAIRLDAVSAVAPGQPAPTHTEGQDTTHFSVLDAGGNAVSCTTTINSTFGGCLVVDGAGFFLNNEMDDFSAKPGSPNQFGLVGGEANAIAPGKRMLSSMTPTLVLQDGKVRYVLGSPGGGRIINTVFQVALNLIDHDMGVVAAVAAPRVHHQWRPDHLFWEPWIVSADVRARLVEIGHRFAPESTVIGRCQAIEVRPDGEIVAASDPRSGGTAVAY